MQRKGLDPTWLVTWCESQVRELETAPNTLQPVHRHPTLAGWDTCWSWWERVINLLLGWMLKNCFIP